MVLVSVPIVEACIKAGKTKNELNNAEYLVYICNLLICQTELLVT